MREDVKTIQELRAFLHTWWCGCGMPETAIATLRKLLELCPYHTNGKELEALIPEDGLRYIVLYTLDHFDLIEHGCGIGGSWLTRKGENVLRLLQSETAAHIMADACCHGYLIDGETCPECSA